MQVKKDDWVWCGVDYLPALQGRKIIKGCVSDYFQKSFEWLFRVVAIQGIDYEYSMSSIQIKLNGRIWTTNGIEADLYGPHYGMWNIGKNYWRLASKEELSYLTVCPDCRDFCFQLCQFV